MDNRKKVMFGIVVVSLFIFLVTVLVFVYALSSEGLEVPPLFSPFLEYHLHFMVIMGLFGVLSGLIMYNILSSTLEKQRKLVKTNVDILMKFLGSDEKELIRKLIEKGGMTTQSEIAKLQGMSRLKAHRIVKKLEARGIIIVDNHGKINLIRIVDELKQG